MLSSVLKYGILILISMSFYVYAKRSSCTCECRGSKLTCDDIAFCQRFGKCITSICPVCDFSGTSIGTGKKCIEVKAYCQQCETTNATYSECSSEDDKTTTQIMVDGEQDNEDEKMTTRPSMVEEGQENKDDEDMDGEYESRGGNEAEESSDGGDNSTAVKAVIGSAVGLSVIIILSGLIWYFMKNKSRKGKIPQSVSYNVENNSNGTTGDGQDQNKTTVYEEITDLPVYHTLQKEQESDVTELTSDVEVKTKDIDTLKQHGSQSEYMCLQHDGSRPTATNAPPPATQRETDAEYTCASYPGDFRDGSEPTGCAKVSKDLPVYYTLQNEQESDVTELASDVKVKPKDIDILKQNESQSEYMGLQHDANMGTRTNAPAPPQPHSET